MNLQQDLPAAAAAAAATTAAEAATATTATATAAATAEAAATTTTAAAFTRAGFVHREITAIKVLPVEGCHRGIGFRVVCHFDKRKPARPTRLAIHHERRRRNLPMLFKELAQLIFGGLEREITNIQLHTFDPSP